MEYVWSLCFKNSYVFTLPLACNLDTATGDCTQNLTKIMDAHLLKDSNITRIFITTRVKTRMALSIKNSCI